MATSNNDRVTSSWLDGFVKKLWNKIKALVSTKVDVTSIDISGLETTIAHEIKSRYPMDYIRLSTDYNDGSTNISDRPTSGSWSFCVEAQLVKNASSTDYAYIVKAFAIKRLSTSIDTNVADTNGYVCSVGPNTSNCEWERILPVQQSYDSIGSSTKIPVITTNQYGQVVSIEEVTISGGGGSTGYVRTDSYNTFTQTQEIKRTGSTKSQLIIRNDYRDMRIGIDSNGQMYVQDYTGRTNSPSTARYAIESVGTGDDTTYKINGSSETILDRTDTTKVLSVGWSETTEVSTCANGVADASDGSSSHRLACWVNNNGVTKMVSDVDPDNVTVGNAKRLGVDESSSSAQGGYSVGDFNRPVYFQNGVPIPCSFYFS